MTSAEQPRPIIAENLDLAKPAGIRHGFFTREGGVSDGIYRGLNVGLGSNDEPDGVTENRRRVADWFGLPRAGSPRPSGPFARRRGGEGRL